MEHVIPAWMQTRFDRSDRPFILPNHRTIHYRAVKVPACSRHNTAFGEIEDRLANDIASPEDVYLWAFKVHAGLLYLDSRLPQEWSKPHGPRIGVMNEQPDANARAIQYQLDLFRAIVRVWETGGTLSPSPLGSVFVLPSKRSEFDFGHCPLGLVQVNVPPFYYAVFLFDGGMALRQFGAVWPDENAPLHFLREGTVLPNLSMPPVNMGYFERWWFAMIIYRVVEQRPTLHDFGPSHIRLMPPRWLPKGPIDFVRFAAIAWKCGLYISMMADGKFCVASHPSQLQNNPEIV